MVVRILTGHVLDVIQTLPDESVHMVLTSPPY
jgi:DNA modification methylase